MAPDRRLADLADAATAGLRKDPELRLDVRAELLSHLEETAAAHQQEGATPEESIDLALKSFGSAEDTAAQLVEANRFRMRLRTLARLFIQAALVPLAAVIALVITVRERDTIRDWLAYGLSPQWTWKEYARGPKTPPLSDSSDLLDRMDPANRLIVAGDTSRKDTPDRNRAIWESDPGNKVYYAYYISMACWYRSREYGNCDEPCPTAQDLRFWEDLNRANTVDPDNARYDVIRAATRLQIAFGRGWISPVHKFNVEDPTVTKVLDEFEDDLRLAAKKPYYRSYSLDMFRLRTSLLPEAHTRGDFIQKLTATHVPEFNMLELIALGRILALQTRRLDSQGRRAEAEELMTLWEPLMLRAMDGATRWTDALVFNAALAQGTDALADVCNDWGDTDKAARMRARARALTDPFSKTFLAWRRQFPSDSVAWPVGEYLRFDYAASTVLISVLLLLLVDTLVVAGRWRRGDGSQSALLVLPSPAIAFGLLLACALPLVAYFIYAHWTPLAGRSSQLNTQGHRVAAEWGTAASAALLLGYALMRRNVRIRCRQIGIAAPPETSPIQRYGIALLACFLGVGLWSAYLWASSQTANYSTSALLLQVVTAGVLLLQLRLLLHLVIRPKHYRAYYGTLAKTLAPLCAAALLLTVLLVRPALSHAERTWVQDAESHIRNGQVWDTDEQALTVLHQAKAQLQQTAQTLPFP